MAEFETIRPQVTGVRTAEIDEGLRAHMNKIYSTMSVGLLVTAGAAWGVGTSPALVEAIFATPLKWLVMFAPLILVFVSGIVFVLALFGIAAIPAVYEPDPLEEYAELVGHVARAVFP